MERSRKEYRTPDVKEVGRVEVETLGPPDLEGIETDPMGQVEYRIPNL